MPKRLRSVIYGPAGIGKSRLAETAPGPRLILDCESGAEFLKKPQIEWENVYQPIPTEGLTDDTSVVLWVDNWQTLVAARDILLSGNHPFRSVIIDTLTDLQGKLKDNLSQSASGYDLWGRLLDELEVVLKQLRDLTKHRTNPLWSVTITAHADTKDGLIRPMLQGQMTKKLAGLYDLVGYYRPAFDPISGMNSRELVIAPYPGIEAKDRTDTLTQTYGPVVKNPNLTDFIQVLNAEEAA